MRPIKFLVLALSVTTASAAGAQGVRHPEPKPDSARVEVPRTPRQQLQGDWRGPHGRQVVVGAGRLGFRHGARMGFRAGGGMGFMAGRRAGFRAGQRMGFMAGRRAGFRAGLNATPAQKEFFTKLLAQRKALREQVVAGTLTRDAAREQMRTWVREHRPE